MTRMVYNIVIELDYDEEDYPAALVATAKQCSHKGDEQAMLAMLEAKQLEREPWSIMELLSIPGATMRIVGSIKE